MITTSATSQHDHDDHDDGYDDGCFFLQYQKKRKNSRVKNDGDGDGDDVVAEMVCGVVEEFGGAPPNALLVVVMVVVVVQAIRPTKTSSSWLAAAAAANVKRTLLTLLWVLPPRLFFWLLFGLGVVCTVKSADVLCYSSLHFHYDTLLTYLLTPCCCWFNPARTHQPQIQIFWFLVVEFMNCF
jgi:hypothetical protein